MRKIVVDPHFNMNWLIHYFDFNSIPYQKDGLFDQRIDYSGRSVIPRELLGQSDLVLFMNPLKFLDLCDWPTSYNQIVEFCQQGNRICVWADRDGSYAAFSQVDRLLKLDQVVDLNSITFFIDAPLSDRHPVSTLKNIRLKLMPYSWFCHMPRILHAEVTKQNCSRDFLLTTVVKKDRLHRQVLKKQMERIPGLLDRGHVRFSRKENRDIDWIGQHQNGWKDGFPAMDLYRDAWLELVPETLYKNAYFFTEKTAKPMATQTPFLMVSTRYYLEYLHSLGFKTFGDIIDESYDQEPRIETRISMVLQQLQAIIKNGSQAFYNECQPILLHNQNRLLEINGRRQYEIDLFIEQSLQELNVR